MRLRGRCDTIRVGVVGCGLFATPNSLKSHKRQKELSPLVQHSCHNAKVVHAFEANTPFEKLPGTQINVPRLNLHKRPRHHRLPLPAVSFIEGFRTPATVQAASSRSAGIRNPQQKPTSITPPQSLRAILVSAAACTDRAFPWRSTDTSSRWPRIRPPSSAPGRTPS